MRWLEVVAFAGLVGLAVLLLRLRRVRGSFTHLNGLMQAGRHQEVLDHPLPPKPFDDPARVLQATSALLLGRFALALDLLAACADDGTYPGVSDNPLDPARLRAVSLNGLGRYGEVARLLGDRPASGTLRRVRAQAAVEVGDDELAESLLADGLTDPLGEAGRQRMLGDLYLRRGRLEEGERLVRTARASYAGSGGIGTQVDAAVCTLHLAEARLSAGLPAEALPLLRSGLEGLGVRPDNAPAFAEAHCLAARINAALGDGPEAGRQLAAAQEHACRCQSPPVDADVTRSTALVAVELGDHEAGRRLLTEALAAYEQLGARPMVADLRSRLADLDG